MKILFITHYGRLYGANRSLLDLVYGLKNKGVEPHILSFEEGEVVTAFKQKNISIKVISLFPWIIIGARDYLFTPFRILKDILKLPYLLYWARKLKPDIIYSNSSIFHIGILLSFCLGKPHIWHIREFGWKDYRVKYVLPKYIRNILFSESTKLIAISEAISREVLNGYNNKVIYNGIVDLKDIPDEPKVLKQGNTPIIFSIIGQLMPTKGQMVAIKAFSIFYKKNKNARLIIVGDGDINYENRLKKVVVDEKLDHVITFTGFVSKVEKIYDKTDIFLMCSYSEGMGRVTIEALAHGIPVIGYAGGATSELVKDGFNGYLYNDFEDYVALSDIMASIIKHSETYNKLSARALEYSKKFTKENYVNTIYNELSDLLPFPPKD